MNLYNEISVASWKHQQRQTEIIAPKEKEKEKGKIAINSDKTVYHKILKRWLMESIIPFNQMEHMFPDQCLPGTIVWRWKSDCPSMKLPAIPQLSYNFYSWYYSSSYNRCKLIDTQNINRNYLSLLIHYLTAVRLVLTIIAATENIISTEEYRRINKHSNGN